MGALVGNPVVQNWRNF